MSLIKCRAFSFLSLLIVSGCAAEMDPEEGEESVAALDADQCQGSDPKCYDMRGVVQACERLKPNRFWRRDVKLRRLSGERRSVQCDFMSYSNATGPVFQTRLTHCCER